jgi:hypothetical protein
MMGGILTFLAVWFLVSIPSSLLIGMFLARRSSAARPLAFNRYISPLETTEIPAL